MTVPYDAEPDWRVLAHHFLAFLSGLFQFWYGAQNHKLNPVKIQLLQDVHLNYSTLYKPQYKSERFLTLNFCFEDCRHVIHSGTLIKAETALILTKQ